MGRRALGARLADQAADAGARLGIEFLPGSTIRTVHGALRLVQDAGHAAGGIVVDVRHAAAHAATTAGRSLEAVRFRR